MLLYFSVLFIQIYVDVSLRKWKEATTSNPHAFHMHTILPWLRLEITGKISPFNTYMHSK